MPYVDPARRRENQRKRRASLSPDKRREVAEYHLEYMRAYRAAHREEINAKDRARRAAHPKEINASDRARRAEYMRRHRQENPRVGLGGQQYELSALPTELRPVARLIRETRLEIKRRTA